MMILDSNDYNTVKKIKKQVMLTKNAFQFFLFYDCNMYWSIYKEKLQWQDNIYVKFAPYAKFSLNLYRFTKLYV